MRVLSVLVRCLISSRRAHGFISDAQRVIGTISIRRSTVQTSKLISVVRRVSELICFNFSRFDISDEFSFTHMLEFSKLAVAFAVELGSWTKSD